MSGERVAGIFIGGAGVRMGGAPKGLLVGPARQTLIARWCELFAELAVPVVLVGEGEAYAGLSTPALRDEPPGIGPLGGLLALLRHAGAGQAIVVACDMPWISRPLLQRLLHDDPGAPLLAAWQRDRWQPFFARYHAPTVLPIAERCLAEGHRALHTVLDAAGAQRLQLTDDELTQLRDWDTAEDVTRDGGPWS